MLFRVERRSLRFSRSILAPDVCYAEPDTAWVNWVRRRPQIYGGAYSPRDPVSIGRAFMSSMASSRVLLVDAQRSPLNTDSASIYGPNTYVMWASWNSTPASGSMDALVSIGAYMNVVGLWNESGTLKMFWNYTTSGIYRTTQAVSISTGEAYCVAVVAEGNYTGAKVRFFLNGTLIGAAVSVNGDFSYGYRTGDSDTYYLGQVYQTSPSGFYYHNGYLGPFGVWARALTNSEVAELSGSPDAMRRTLQPTAVQVFVPNIYQPEKPAVRAVHTTRKVYAGMILRDVSERGLVNALAPGSLTKDSVDVPAHATLSPLVVGVTPSTSPLQPWGASWQTCSIDSYVRFCCSTKASTLALDEYSQVYWHRPSAITADAYAHSDFITKQKLGYYSSTDNYYWKVNFQTSTSQLYISSTEVATVGKLVCLAFTYKKNDAAHFYINGVEVGTPYAGADINQQFPVMGYQHRGNLKNYSYSSQGDYGPFLMFTRALSATEVKLLAQYPEGVFPTTLRTTIAVPTSYPATRRIVVRDM